MKYKLVLACPETLLTTRITTFAYKMKNLKRVEKKLFSISGFVKRLKLSSSLALCHLESGIPP